MSQIYANKSFRGKPNSEDSRPHRETWTLGSLLFKKGSTVDLGHGADEHLVTLTVRLFV